MVCPDVAVQETTDWASATVPETDVGALEVKLNKFDEALWPSMLVTTTVVAPAIP
jgi:hypothetical protein